LQVRAFNRLFRTAKPLIGAVHLRPLPGAPGRGGTLEKVIAAALADADAIVKGGADGLIVENFGDAPFFKDRVPPHTVAAMTVATLRIRERFPKVPLGVNVLRNDASAAVGIAAAVGADFIRVNVHTGVYATDQGIIEGRAHETLRLRESLRSSVLIFADVNVKHAASLDGRDAAVLAKEAAERGLADAVIITGPATGAAALPEEVGRAGAAVSVPLIVGSGITPQTVGGYFADADGFIVGTYLKRAGRIENPVDAARVRKLISAVSRLRRPKRR